MLALQHEDDVRPFQVGLAHAPVGVRAHPGRPHLEPRVVPVKPRGGHAALLVHGADEEDLQLHGTTGPSTRLIYGFASKR